MINYSTVSWTNERREDGVPMYSLSNTAENKARKPVRVKSEIVEHLDLFTRIALEELASRGMAEIVP